MRFITVLNLKDRAIRNTIIIVIYDDRGYVSLKKQDNNKVFKDKDVKKYLDEYKSFSGMWLKFGQDKYNYDNNFKEVSDYLLNNDIKDMLN